MVDLIFSEDVNLDDINPEGILLEFIKKDKTYIHVTKENITELKELDSKVDYILLTDILETEDNPTDIIEQMKKLSENLAVFEFKDEFYTNPNWKHPWKSIGLEGFLTKNFDYVNSIFLGYATVHICEIPYYNNELENEGLNVIR